jgi:hypothetical protein
MSMSLKLFTAIGKSALIRLLAGMDPHMDLQVALFVKAFITKLAFKRLLPGLGL